jgi:hypothetical protein
MLDSRLRGNANQLYSCGGRPRNVRTRNFAGMQEAGLCDKRNFRLGFVVSFLWFVSLDKQRNEHKSISCFACEVIRPKRTSKTRINERPRQRYAVGNIRGYLRSRIKCGMTFYNGLVRFPHTRE